MKLLFLRVSITLLLFLASLLNFFPVPAHALWYVGIAVPEFPWIFMIAALFLLGWNGYERKWRKATTLITAVAFIIFTSPIIRAYTIGVDINERLVKSFGPDVNEIKGFHQDKPFTFLQMFSGHGAKDISFTTYHYAEHSGIDLTLNFYPSAVPGIRPCLIVVHGGSWRSGDNSEIKAVNNYYANAGYQVATINYRLAPKFHSPAPQEDLHAAFTWLRKHAAELNIDTSNFVLTGRSAGAQIVLTMAYTGNENGVKGVAAFYGPTDMFYSYEHPDNPLIMDSREVQRGFLGGAPNEVPDRYTAESAIMHVTPQTTPTVLIHGEQDAHVWSIQAERLGKTLDDNKVNNLVLLFPWATHGCEYNLNGPAGQLSLYTVERFFYAVTQNKQASQLAPDTQKR